MNEKIKILAEEAVNAVQSRPNGICDMNKYNQKFAELIISKCIEIDVDNPDAAPGIEIAKYFEVNMAEDEKIIYDAWRNAESYQVPMTDQGLKLADARYYGFKRGWYYSRFYAKHGHTDMKEYNERTN